MLSWQTFRLIYWHIKLLRRTPTTTSPPPPLPRFSTQQIHSRRRQRGWRPCRKAAVCRPTPEHKTLPICRSQRPGAARNGCGRMGRRKKKRRDSLQWCSVKQGFLGKTKKLISRDKKFGAANQRNICTPVKVYHI